MLNFLHSGQEIQSYQFLQMIVLILNQQLICIFFNFEQLMQMKPNPFLKRGKGSSRSVSLKRIICMNEDNGKKEDQGSIKQISKNKQNSPIQFVSIPQHAIPQAQQRTTIRRVVIRTKNKTVKSQTLHTSMPFSDPNLMIQETNQKKYFRLLQSLKTSIKTKDMKVEDISTQLLEIYKIFRHLLSDLQKKIEFHKPGPQRSQRYFSKRRQLEQKLEQAKQTLKQYQQKYKKSKSFYQEACEKNDPKASQWKIICLNNIRFIYQYSQKASSLMNQILQCENEISLVKRVGVQVFLFERHKLLNTQKDQSQIQQTINTLIRKYYESQLTVLRHEMDQLQEQEKLMRKQMQEAKEKEISIEKRRSLKTQYKYIKEKMEMTEQMIRNIEECLENQ